MQQLVTLWTTLDARRRVVILAATVAMFAAVLGLTRMAANPSMTLLYSGLEGSAAGEVVRALEQRGVAYDVRGGAIFVSGGQRDELRMILASEGLPRNGGQGYELLDSLSGFGTTSQMFDAAYWRAKEGELARTIAASPQIETARVHIANAASNPFRRDIRPTASVFVTGGGGTIPSSHAKALRFLVASAVAGLSPDDVAIVDSSGELIGNSEDDAPSNGSDERAEMLRDRVQRLLEARVGMGNAVVEISVDTETESESIREHRFDPQGRVAISTETEERSNNSQNSNAGGDVTVASNLPDGGGGAGGGDSSTQNSETRERINYEVSETQREVIRAPGAIKRVTVAALINGVPGDDPAVQMVPRGPDELAELRELIASAVGFDEARGDVITLKSMQFQPLEELGTGAQGGWIQDLSLDVTNLIQMAVLALVALILGMFVVRPILTRKAPALAQLAAPGASASADTALTGEIDDGEFELADLPMISGFDDPDGNLPTLGAGSDDPVQRLRNLIGEREEESVEILRSWLEDSEETV